MYSRHVCCMNMDIHIRHMDIYICREVFSLHVVVYI